MLDFAGEAGPTVTKREKDVEGETQQDDKKNQGV